jgi:hypothetical protein
MRFEPAGQIGFGMEVKKCFAEGFNTPERESANGLLLPGRKRAQAAVQLTQYEFNLTLGYSNPYKRISAQDILGDPHVSYATQFSAQFQTLLSHEFLIRK